MKITRFALYSAFTILTSCASNKISQDFSTPSKVEEFVQQTALIQLEGNPTTGFTWEYELLDDSIVDIQKTVKYLGTEDIVGAPSSFNYTISSKKRGSTILFFKYHRPWESEPPLKTKTYQINVNNDGSIVIQE